MLKSIAVAAGLFGATTALAQEADLTQAPPPAPYQAVSDLVELPEFLPGLVSFSSTPQLCRPGRSWVTIMTASSRPRST